MIIACIYCQKAFKVDESDLIYCGGDVYFICHECKEIQVAA